MARTTEKPPRGGRRRSGKGGAAAGASCASSSPDGNFKCIENADHKGACGGGGKFWSGKNWTDVTGKVISISGADNVKRKTDVDGKPAIVDGTTPKQQPLIPPDPNEILGRLRKKHGELASASLVLGERKAAYDEQKKTVEKLQEQHNSIVAELCNVSNNKQLMLGEQPAAAPAKDAKTDKGGKSDKEPPKK